MKRLFFLSLFLFLFVACGGSESAIESAPPEVEPSEETAVIPTEGAQEEEETAVTPTEEAQEEAEPSVENEENDSTSGTGSISDAVIDTSIESADSVQQSPEALLSDGRVAVGDADGDEAESAMAVSLITSVIEVSDFLASNPTWRASAFRQDGYYSLVIRGEGSDELLGWGTVNIDEQTVLSYFVARMLTPEEFQEGSSIIEAYVFGEEIVATALGDFSAWEYETKYRHMEGIWEIHLQQGDAKVVIPVDSWEERYFIDEIYNIVTEDTADSDQQSAIAIARSGPGVEEILSRWDNWQIYVAQREGSEYAVSFTAPERELFYARVDIDSGEIINSAPGYR
ncbi:MAG: hypothetical protein AAF490_24960 [Chloroflexota bacterium]